MSELFTNYEIGSIEMLIIGSFLMAAAWRLSKEAVSIIRKQKELMSLNIK